MYITRCMGPGMQALSRTSAFTSKLVLTQLLDSLLLSRPITLLLSGYVDAPLLHSAYEVSSVCAAKASSCLGAHPGLALLGNSMQKSKGVLLTVADFYIVNSNLLSLVPHAIGTPALRSDDEAILEDGDAQEAAEAVAAKPRHKVRYIGLETLMQAPLPATLHFLSLQAPPRKRQKLQDFAQPAPAPGSLKGARRFQGLGLMLFPVAHHGGAELDSVLRSCRDEPRSVNCRGS